MMEETVAKPKDIQVLEFERPIADLEQKIEELRGMSN